MRITFKPLPRVLLCLLVIVTFPSCKQANSSQPPMMNVVVAHPTAQEVVEWDEYSGRLESPTQVNLSARVSGIIVSAGFTEGALVKKGDLLFVLDDRSFKADFASKSAAVSKADAQRVLAQFRVDRYNKIRDSKAISDEDYDQAVATLRQAQAELEANKAAEELARLNLEWTRVVAPIDGRVGRKLVTEGNLVNGGSGQPTLLTTISAVDPLYCYIQIPERRLAKYQELIAENPLEKIPFEIRLENEKEFTHQGSLDFVDNHVDPTTGTVQARGVISNPGIKLAPGQFARARLLGSRPYTTLLVPDSAIGADQNSRYVLLVKNPEHTVEVRPVVLGALFGASRAISSGLSPTDSIVVNGLQFARPGMKVNPSEAPSPTPSISPQATDAVASVSPQATQEKR